jgi:hypothetical protein
MARETNYQISVLLPDGWEDVTAFSFLGPERQGHRGLITLSVDPKVSESSVSEYATRRSVYITRASEVTEVMMEGPGKLADDREIYEIAVREGTGADASYCRVAYLLEGGKGYTFQCRSNRASRDLNELAFRQLLESFSPSR